MLLPLRLSSLWARRGAGGGVMRYSLASWAGIASCFDASRASFGACCLLIFRLFSSRHQSHYDGEMNRL